MTRYKKQLDRMLSLGETDARLGKPISAFEGHALMKHPNGAPVAPERMRAAYEIGWRSIRNASVKKEENNE